jgi:hypothetical protein
VQNKATTPNPASTLAVVATAVSLSGKESFGRLCNSVVLEGKRFKLNDRRCKIKGKCKGGGKEEEG